MAIGNAASGEVLSSENSHEASSKQEEKTSSSGNFQCPKCEKHFGNYQILQLHLRVHNSSREVGQELVLSSKDVCLDVRNGCFQNTSHNKKLIGLTKIRMEDCLRCDACSCIYLDKSDYNKHMKNFHRHDSPKKHRPKKGCRSCCKHCNCKGNHQHQNVQKERGNNNLFHYSLKDRWSKMVSRRLTPEEMRENIKADPDFEPAAQQEMVDYTHLLSQVEVKIKTEPAEDAEHEHNVSFASG